LVRTLVLGEPLAVSFLKDDPQHCYPKDVDMIRENTFKHLLVQEAIYRGETEKAVRIPGWSYRQRRLLLSAYM
jgi:hypothetical protein